MSRAPEVEPDWELVRKRNFVERLKAEKAGLDVIHDLPAMIESGYEAVPEEDMVRLQWYGLYHDKPKLGYFMLRVRVPGGVLTPAGLRTIGRVAERFGAPAEQLPLYAYRSSSSYSMRTDALDRLGTQLEQRFTADQIREMMTQAGLERVEFSPEPPYWCAVGYKSAR